MEIVAHDLEESLPRARAVLIVGRSAQFFQFLFDQGDGLPRGIATSCSHVEMLLGTLEECSHHRLLLPVVGLRRPYLGLLVPYLGLFLPYWGLLVPYSGLELVAEERIHRNKYQVVESHVGWDLGTVGHDPEENLPTGRAAAVEGTI